MLTNSIVSFEQLSPGDQTDLGFFCLQMSERHIFRLDCAGAQADLHLSVCSYMESSFLILDVYENV